MSAYFKHIYKALSTIGIGMAITFKSMFRKSVTIQYPEQRLQLPERERNRLFVNMEDCIGCDQCAKACPVSCIEIDTIKAVPGDIVGKTGVTSQGKKKALFVPKFTIDFAKCCFCQLCVFPCPTDCIYMTDVFEYSEFKRENLIYDFTDMSPEQTEEKKRKLAEYQEEQARKKEEAAKTAAASKSQTTATAPATGSGTTSSATATATATGTATPDTTAPAPAPKTGSDTTNTATAPATATDTATPDTTATATAPATPDTTAPVPPDTTTTATATATATPDTTTPAPAPKTGSDTTNTATATATATDTATPDKTATAPKTGSDTTTTATATATATDTAAPDVPKQETSESAAKPDTEIKKETPNQENENKIE